MKKRKILEVVLVASGLLLAACGGKTNEADDLTSTSNTAGEAVSVETPMKEVEEKDDKEKDLDKEVVDEEKKDVVNEKPAKNEEKETVVAVEKPVQSNASDSEEKAKTEETEVSNKQSSKTNQSNASSSNTTSSKSSSTAQASKAVSKPAQKPAQKPAPKPEPKPAPKPAQKPAPKPAPKPEPKPAPKPEPKPAPKPAPVDDPYDRPQVSAAKANAVMEGIKGAYPYAQMWAPPKSYVFQETADVIIGGHVGHDDIFMNSHSQTKHAHDIIINYLNSQGYRHMGDSLDGSVELAFVKANGKRYRASYDRSSGDFEIHIILE